MVEDFWMCSTATSEYSTADSDPLSWLCWSCIWLHVYHKNIRMCTVWNPNTLLGRNHHTHEEARRSAWKIMCCKPDTWTMRICEYSTCTATIEAITNVCGVPAEGTL